MADKRSTLDQMMQDRKARKKRHEHWEQMDPWEKDREGNYAGGKNIVDCMFVIAAIPFIGAAFTFAFYGSWEQIGKSWTGIGHQNKRMGDLSVILQFLYIVIGGIIYIA